MINVYFKLSHGYLQTIDQPLLWQSSLTNDTGTMPWYRWCQPGVCCHTDNNIINPRSSVSMSRHSRHCHSVSWFDRFITWLGSFVCTTGGWGSCDTWQPIVAGFVIWGLQVQIPGWRFECLCVWTASLKDWCVQCVQPTLVLVTIVTRSFSLKRPLLLGFDEMRSDVDQRVPGPDRFISIYFTVGDVCVIQVQL